jgi:hypothetical protein
LEFLADIFGALGALFGALGALVATIYLLFLGAIHMAERLLALEKAWEERKARKAVRSD